jgi:Domain of unknown function (DUF4911)
MDARPSDVVSIYLRLPRREIAYVKFVFESYEGVAVCRTLDRHEALLVAMVVPDALAQARRIVEALAAEGACEEVPAPAGMEDPLGPNDDE